MEFFYKVAQIPSINACIQRIFKIKVAPLSAAF